ncbi:hypothetical protein AGOR_G00022370 [Albula goreensis]|uniref:Uncharacterized protein n=1 Tax=Albula goreensis TaxID=1534307 RepID=A0A8T3E5Q0_9TELE|nr:hypothetical protein AGOR_G00022370 [Albula goreensis]
MRAHLLSVQNVMDAVAELCGQRTITGFLRQEESPAQFAGESERTAPLPSRSWNLSPMSIMCWSPGGPQRL